MERSSFSGVIGAADFRSALSLTGLPKDFLKMNR